MPVSMVVIARIMVTNHNFRMIRWMLEMEHLFVVFSQIVRYFIAKNENSIVLKGNLLYNGLRKLSQII